jgi:hypothetical protein
MEEKKRIQCDCGWTLTSQYGEDDLLKHGKILADDAHADMKLSREDLKIYIKSA